MTNTFKARYANGALTPLEPLDLAEGAEVTVSIAGEPAAGGSPVGVAETSATYDARPPDMAAGSIKEEPAAGEQGAAAVLKLIDELHAAVPDQGLSDRPTDMAENYKHYLYGWPRDRER